MPAKEFLKNVKIEEWINEDGNLHMIGHIRYSTSDLRYNQPFCNEDVSIVHNGVISQEPVETWPFKTETANDSELILRAIEAGLDPLLHFHDKSMAVCVLHKNGSLYGFRNHERPLWFTKVDNGVIFTSTKDIAKRSGLEGTEKCAMFTEYCYKDEKLIATEFASHGHKDLQ